MSPDQGGLGLDPEQPIHAKYVGSFVRSPCQALPGANFAPCLPGSAEGKGPPVTPVAQRARPGPALKICGQSSKGLLHGLPLGGGLDLPTVKPGVALRAWIPTSSFKLFVSYAD